MGLLDFSSYNSNDPSGMGLSQDDQRALLAQALSLQQRAGDTSPIRSPWQGASRLADGLFAGIANYRAGAAQRAQQQGLANALRGLMPGGQPSAAIAPTPSYAPAQSAPGGPAMANAGDVANSLGGLPVVRPPGDIPGATEAYIRTAAAQRGIDPDIAVRVAKSEGLNSYTGDSGSSFGPYQLHYGGVAGGGNRVPGLGDEFSRQTGLDARDPSTVQKQIDFALDNASQNGWSAFHGAARSGVGRYEGIGGAPSQGTQLAGDVPTIGAVPTPPPRPADLGAAPVPVPETGGYGAPLISKGQPQTGPAYSDETWNNRPQYDYGAPSVNPLATALSGGAPSPSISQTDALAAALGGAPMPVPRPATPLPPSRPVEPLPPARPANVGVGVPSPVARPENVGNPVPLPPSRPADLGMSGASQIAGSMADIAIPVPGYEGKITRAQADDSEGKPSPAEWDAAAKTMQDAPAAAPVAPVAPIAPVAQAPATIAGQDQLGAPAGAHYAQLPGPPLLLPGSGGDAGGFGFGGLGSALSNLFGLGGAPPFKGAAGGAAIPPGASGQAKPISGQLADNSSFNGISAQQMRSAMAILQNPSAPEGLRAIAKDIYERAVLPQQQGHLLSDQEVTAAGLPSGKYQVSKEGAISPITGTQDKETQTGEIKNYEYYKKNFMPSDTAQAPMTFDQWNVAKSNAGKPTESILDQRGQPIDESKVSGPDVLSVVPPDVGRMAQAMIEGRSPVPNLSIRTDPVTRQAVLAAQKADPSLDVGNATARVKVRNEFFAGGPSSPAARMTAGNNAINHIDEANYYAQQLHDLGYDTLNAAANAMTSGSSAVGLALKGYNTAVNNFAGEIVKFNTGSEGALEDRREKAALFSQNLTAGERKTAMESQIGILMSNMTSLQKRWRDGMGPLVPDFETIHPDSTSAIERIKGNQPYPPAGGLPPSMRGPVGVGATQMAPTVGVPATPVHVTSPDEASKLPPGTWVILPDGSKGRVPGG